MRSRHPWARNALAALILMLLLSPLLWMLQLSFRSADDIEIQPDERILAEVIVVLRDQLALRTDDRAVRVFDVDLLPESQSRIEQA